MHQRADSFLCLSARLVFERKGHKMKITYKFVTGEVVEVEVSEEIGGVIVDLDRLEYNNDHKETRRHCSLEGKAYEGMEYAVEDPGLEALFAGPTDEDRLRAAIQKLDPGQQAMIRAIYFEGVSVNDYAARMGVTQSAISHRLQTVKKNLKKLLGWPSYSALLQAVLRKEQEKQPSRKDERHEAQAEDQRVQGAAERRGGQMPQCDTAGEDAHPAPGPQRAGDDPHSRQHRGIPGHHRAAGGRCNG